MPARNQAGCVLVHSIKGDVEFTPEPYSMFSMITSVPHSLSREEPSRFTEVGTEVREVEELAPGHTAS